MRCFLYLVILLSQFVFADTILKGKYIKDVKSPGERIFLTRVTGLVGEKGKFIISVDDINYEELWNNNIVVLDLYQGSHVVCVNVVGPFGGIAKKNCMDIDLKENEKKFFVLLWKNALFPTTLKFIPETAEEFLKN